MSRQAFIHVNGETYEVARPIDDEQSVEFMELDEHMRNLGGGGGHTATIEVVLGGVSAPLHLTSQGVFAAAVYLAAERPHANAY